MQIKLFVVVVVWHFPVCPEHQKSETETETLFYLFITSRLTLFHCFIFRSMPYGQLAWRVSSTQQ